MRHFLFFTFRWFLWDTFFGCERPAGASAFASPACGGGDESTVSQPYQSADSQGICAQWALTRKWTCLIENNVVIKYKKCSTALTSIAIFLDSKDIIIPGVDQYVSRTQTNVWCKFGFNRWGEIWQVDFASSFARWLIQCLLSNIPNRIKTGTMVKK